MNNLCIYRDIFGKPNEGVHSIRLFDFALVDVVFTIIAAYLLHKYTNLSLSLSILLLFVLAILFHWLFCVDTKLNRILMIS
jgi:hypothetical protein